MAAKPVGRLTKQDMKQDRFVSWMFYLAEQFRRNKGAIFGTLGGVVVVIVVVVLFVGQRQAGQREVEELFGRASVEMRAGNTSLAIIDFRKIVDEHGGATLAGLACYYLANAYYTQRDFNEAETLFRRYLEDYGDDPLLVIAAQWGIGGCLEQRGEFTAAADEYLAAVRLDPEGIMAGDLLFAAVRTSCLAGDRERAMGAYELIQEHYGDSPRVIDAAKLYLYEYRFLDPPLE